MAGIDLYRVRSTQVLFNELNGLKPVVLFCLFGDVNLLVAILGRADDLDDGD